MGLHVSKRDIDVVGGKVNIKNKEMVEALIKNKDLAMEILEGAGSSFDINEISINSSGDIIIDNSAYASSLQAKLDSLDPSNSLLDNGACGAGC